MTDPQTGLELEHKPGGWVARLKGRETFPYVVILMLLCGMAYLVTFSLGNWGQPFNLQASFSTHRDEMNAQHTNYINGVAELTYVMSVCLNPSRVEECKKLRLAMPNSLYRKLDRSDHE